MSDDPGRAGAVGQAGAVDVLVVGGGIAGLTTATVLGRLGHDVLVAERTPDFSTVGAGLGLAAGPEAVLAALEVDLAGVGEPIRRLEVRDAGGRVLQAVSPDGPRAYARPDLHRALLAAVREVADVRGGMVPDADQRAAHDLVVGADGISSATRCSVVGPAAIRYSGATCWRAIVPNQGIDASFEAWGDGVRVGGIPLTEDRLYCFLVRTCPPRSAAPADLPTLQRWMAGIGGEAGDVVGALTAMPPFHHDLDELDRPFWGAGSTVLVGDAAHAVTPNLGFGAGLAIEDAVTLGLLLADGCPAGSAATALRRSRHRRARRVQVRSRRIGQLAQVRSTLGGRVRDTLAAATPDVALRHQQAALDAPGHRLAERLRAAV